MKKIACIILFSIAHSFAMAQSETNDVHWTEPYKIAGTINLFLEGPESMLDTLVPEGAKWGSKNYVYDDDGSLISSEQKTVRELAPHYWPSVNKGNVILLCCAMEQPTFRQKRFSVKDAEDWKYFKAIVWPDVGNFITYKEAKQLMLGTEDEN